MVNKYIKAMCDRYYFIVANIVGKVLDIGANDASGWLHGHKMHGLPFERDNNWLFELDCDKWMHPNMIRADAHHVPYKDKSFNTVVMGDILEHVTDPKTVLSEANRLAIDRIIITLPFEEEWEAILKPFGNSNITRQQSIDSTLGHPSLYAKCIDYLPEDKLRHLPHVRHFNYWTIYELLSVLDKRYKIKVMNLYHPLAPQKPEDAFDTPYWSIIIDKDQITDERLVLAKPEDYKYEGDLK